MATTQAVPQREVWSRGAASSTPVPAHAIEHSIRHSTLRGVGFIGLLGVALIHLLDVIGKISDTPYIGVMYILLMIGSVLLAFALLHTGRPVAWMAAATLAGLTLIGFILSRTTGLPGSSDDVGNWKEGLGLASMFVETGVILVSGYALWLARRERRPGVHESVPVTGA
jgi:hypothetical protein